MKIIFYRDCELFSVLISYLSIYKGQSNFIVSNDNELELISIFFQVSKIDFYNSIAVNRIINSNWLIRILKAIIYFCENKFSIKYFFEIVSLINTELASEFIKFFEKNIINKEFCISKILNFGNLKTLHFNLFSDVVEWYRNLKRFYNFQKTMSFAEIFELNLILLNQILNVFQDNRVGKLTLCNLSKKIINLRIEIPILVYCEYIKIQKIYISHDKNSKNILMNRAIFDENFELLKEKVNVFYFIKNKEELDNFIDSKILRQSSSHVAGCWVFIVDDLKSQFIELNIQQKNTKLYKFIDSMKYQHEEKINNPFFLNTKEDNNPKKNNPEENLQNFYDSEIKKILKSQKEIELNTFSIRKLIKDENKFFVENILNLKTGTFPKESSVISGYFDFLFSNVLKRFFENQQSNPIFLLKEEIEKFYHKFYFGYIYKRMIVVFSNFLICFERIKDLAKEKFYEIALNKKISYKIKIRSKLIKIRCSVWMILKNSDEIILYDFFEKDLTTSDFKELKKPNMIIAALYFSNQFPKKRVTIRYCNLEKEIEEKEIKDVSELIQKLRSSLLKFKKYIEKDVFTSI